MTTSQPPENEKNSSGSDHRQGKNGKDKRQGLLLPGHSTHTAPPGEKTFPVKSTTSAQACHGNKRHFPTVGHLLDHEIKGSCLDGIDPP